MQPSDVKMMVLRRDGQCACGVSVSKGTRAGWHRVLKTVLCAECLTPTGKDEDGVVDIGVPGASLDREYAKRLARREQRIREQQPRIGGLILRFSATPRTTSAFAVGAAGERKVAAELERAVGDRVRFLYNRRRGAGRERGDIDIIAVAPSGIHVIDPKKYENKKVRSDRRGEVFIVNGRRRPSLSASMRAQLEAVTSAVREGPCPEASVGAAYCFVGADLPWTRLTVDGIEALSVKGVKKRLAATGPLTAESIAVLHADLARRFPPA